MSTLRAQDVDLAYQIISRDEARAARLLNYKTGRPCKNGHFRRSVRNGDCVLCRAAIKKAWALAHPEEARARKRKQKKASAGRLAERLAGETTYVPAEPCLRGHLERYVKGRGCVQCAKLASIRRYRENPEARERASQYWKTRRQVDGEALNAGERQRRLLRRALLQTQDEACREAAREKERAKEKRRRARKSGAEGRHTAAEVKALLIKQRGRCAYCRKSIKAYYEEDHIVALAKGGSDYISNIQLTCGPCNWSKGARHPITFAQSVGLLI